MTKHTSRKDRIKISQSIHNMTIGARSTVLYKFIKGKNYGENQRNDKRV